MKKSILFLFTILTIVACGGGDDAGGNNPSSGSEYLNVNNVEAMGDQTSVTLNVEASKNCEWTITWNESWIRSVSPAKGRGQGSATITFDVNPSSSTSRKATLTVCNTSGSITRNVTVTQSASNEQLTISGAVDGKLTFPSASDGKEYKITVTSNTHWKVQGIPSWLTVTPTEGNDNGEVTIKAMPNQSKDILNATLIFKGDGGASKEIQVTQEAASLPVVTKPQVLTFGKNEATISFTFTSEVPVTAYGICYDTKENPDLESSPYEPKTGSATEADVTIQLKNLSSGTTYYIRAYATSAVGTTYSSETVTLTTVSNWPENGDNTTPGI